MNGKSDGCTDWIDSIGPWSFRHCCTRHDEPFLDGSVTLTDHVDLGLCVIQSAPWWGIPVALVMGPLMVGATTAWWLHRHKNRYGQRRR